MENLKELMLRKEVNLSPYATKSSEVIRLLPEEEDIRPAFFHDADRIIYALSYTRYLDKTQVYSYQENDHISKRIVHVQFVSKIARTIGRALNLNEDLIEAIALGHDIGHTPLGHRGEAILNEICQKELHETFAHNIQSVRNYMEIENHGLGLNLSIQVLDGIMCHNGEMLSPIYQPNSEKTPEEFLKEYHESYFGNEVSKKMHPMTLEGCVVRISDIIAYIGRDIEDAITLGLFDRKDIPEEIVNVLGNNNRDIINNITLDIIRESTDKPYIKLSDEVFYTLNKLKNFNYQHIYHHALSNEQDQEYRKDMQTLYQRYLDDIKKENRKSVIYNVFLDNMSSDYLKKNRPERIVIDFLSGMTDDFFKEQLKK